MVKNVDQCFKTSSNPWLCPHLKDIQKAEYSNVRSCFDLFGITEMMNQSFSHSPRLIGRFSINRLWIPVAVVMGKQFGALASLWPPDSFHSAVTSQCCRVCNRDGSGAANLRLQPWDVCVAVRLVQANSCSGFMNGPLCVQECAWTCVGNKSRTPPPGPSAPPAPPCRC